MRSTHTSAILEVSKKTYEEIAEKMRAAGYDHVFLQGRYGPEHMDMNGIMLRREQPSYDHSKRTTKYHEPTLGFCICEHCEKLPTWEEVKGPHAPYCNRNNPDHERPAGCSRDPVPDEE